MHNSIQMNATPFTRKVSGRLEVPASPMGFSRCHLQVPELSCCAELHGKVDMLYMGLIDFAVFCCLKSANLGALLAV